MTDLFNLDKEFEVSIKASHKKTFNTHDVATITVVNNKDAQV